MGQTYVVSVRKGHVDHGTLVAVGEHFGARHLLAGIEMAIDHPPIVVLYSGQGKSQSEQGQSADIGMTRI